MYKRQAENFISDATDLSAGDLIVHIEHGIGRYEGLEAVIADGAPHDCLRLTYAGGDRLFVPVENVELLSRFGSGDGSVTFDRLGGAAWQSRKSKLKKQLLEMAGELIETAAERTLKLVPLARESQEFFFSQALGFRCKLFVESTQPFDRIGNCIPICHHSA